MFHPKEYNFNILKHIYHLKNNNMDQKLQNYLLIAQK